MECGSIVRPFLLFQAVQEAEARCDMRRLAQLFAGGGNAWVVRQMQRNGTR